MPSDYAKRRQPRKTTRKTSNRRKKSANKTPKAPLWAWLVIGALLAILITLLIFLANRGADRTSPKAPTAGVEKEEEAYKFEFYERLKKLEVEVEDRSAEVQAATPDDVALYLQVASFRDQQTANELRATLILQNMKAGLEEVNNANGRWYRVVVGPFASRSKMAKARSQLVSQNLNARLLKRKIQ